MTPGRQPEVHMTNLKGWVFVRMRGGGVVKGGLHEEEEPGAGGRGRISREGPVCLNSLHVRASNWTLLLIHKFSQAQVVAVSATHAKESLTLLRITHPMMPHSWGNLLLIR